MRINLFEAPHRIALSPRTGGAFNIFPDSYDIRALSYKSLESPTAHREAETAKAHRG